MKPFSTTRNPLANKIDAGAYTTTHSGIQFPYATFGLRHIKLSDIATHLAKMNRWLGAMRLEHYSVAEHSVLLASYALDNFDTFDMPSDTTPEMLARAFLFHDAEEYIMGDYPSPLKRLLDPVLIEFGDYVRSAIWEKFNIPDFYYNHVKYFDECIRLDEAVYVDGGDKIFSGSQLEGLKYLGVDVHGWSAPVARNNFTDMFLKVF